MAYITIPALPLGTALTGLEQFESVQSSISVKLTANQIKTFASESPSLSIADSATNTVSTAATLLHTTSGTPAVGFGTGLDFQAEANTGGNATGVKLQAILTNVGIGTESFDFAFRLMNLGVAAAEVARFTSTKRLGVGTTSPTLTIHSLIDDTASNAVTRTLQLTHTTSGTAGSGIGTGIAFETENAAGTNKIGAALDAIAVDVTAATEDFDFVFSLMKAGASIAEVMRLTSTGRLGVNTSIPSASLQVVTDDANNNSIVNTARFTHTTTGSPAVGIGTAIDFSTETSSGTVKVGGAIYSESTAIGAGVENFDMAFAVMQTGVAGIEVMRITSTARVGINTTAPVTTLHALVGDAVNSGVTQVERLTHITSGTPAIGIGTGLEFETETANNVYKVGAQINAVTTNVSTGTENFDLRLNTMTANALTEKLRIGDLVYTNQPFGAGTVPDVNAWLHTGAGTATVATFDLDPGVLLTTPFQGALEYEGRSLYFTPNGTERGVIQNMQMYQLNTDFSRSATITTIQSLFGAGLLSKVVSVQAGTRYQYEINATISKAGLVATAIQYALGGTATLTAHDYEVISTFPALAITPTASNLMQNRVVSAFSTLVTVTAASAAAAAAATLRIRGSFDVSVAGTIDFSFGLSVAQAASSLVVVAGSNVALWPVGAAGADTQIGNWT